MGRRLVAAACFAAMVTLMLASPGVALAEDEAPLALIEETRYDFGEVFERKKYAHTFIIKNVGSADLRIEKVQPG